MTDLIIHPRRTKGSNAFWMGVQSQTKFLAHYQIDGGLPPIPVRVDKNGDYHAITSTMPDAMSLVIKASHGLTLQVRRCTTNTGHKIDVSISHTSQFSGEEMIGGKQVEWQAMPFYERAVYVLDLTMSPGQSIAVKGAGFELDVSVQ
jgi:hypothetical protein